MFTEVIKLVPALDKGALNSMFANLSNRFMSVARKFGDGMKNALKFGGIVGVASGLLAKLLNPLQKAEEIMDRLLHKGDDAVTNAQEFGSTPGKVLRMQALGAARGMDPETLFNLVRKFQGALAKEQEAAILPERIQGKLQEERDPLKRRILEVQLKEAQEAARQGGTLHEFINEKDTVEGFYKLVQSLRLLPKEQQTVVQSEIFGERMRGRAAELFNATDDAQVLRRFQPSGALDKAANKVGELADIADLNEAVRGLDDFVTKSGLVNKGQIEKLDVSKRLDMKDENQSLKRFDATLSTSIAVQQLTEKFDDFITRFINDIAPDLVEGINTVSDATPFILDGVKEIATVAKENLPSLKKVKDVLQAGFDGVLEFVAKLKVRFEDNGIEGVATEAKNSFGDFLGISKLGAPAGPSPFAVANEQRRQEISADIDKLSESIDRFNKAFYDAWAEFKGSRIYRTFGGGN